MTEIQPHSPVYISHGYGWAPDAWKDKRLKDIDDEMLTELIEQHLTAENELNTYSLVEAAKDPDHPLHEFLYDEPDETAAHRWRGHQAQEIPRNVVRMWRHVQTGKVERDIVRAFVSLGKGGNTEQEGVYKLVEIKRTTAALPAPETKRAYAVQRKSVPTPEPQAPEQPPAPTVTPEPQAPEPAPMHVAAPPAAAIAAMPEQHKRSLQTLKAWAQSHRHNAYFAPIVALIDTYPDPD